MFSLTLLVQAPLTRDGVSAWAWKHLAGLQGVHEGTQLAERQVLDVAGPTDRDWVGDSPHGELVFYFQTREEAEQASSLLQDQHGLEAAPQEVAQEDWNARWQDSFSGVDVPPHWAVRPPWDEGRVPQGVRLLRINPGSGFGTGTHETTQLCLQWLTELGNLGEVLDLGSGSGVLSIAAHHLGASPVWSVEIDELARDNAQENFRLNGCEDIALSESMPEGIAQGCVVVANILKPVLVDFAPRLCGLKPRAILLSGMLEQDVAEVLAAYQVHWPGVQAQSRHVGEWWALLLQ